MTRSLALLAVAATALAQPTPTKQPPASHQSAAPSAAPSYRDLKFPALRPIAAPAVQKFTLPDGMHLLLLENHELPLINGTVLVRTGSAFDPPEKLGLAVLTTQVMLEGGTAAKPGDGLVRRFQGLGADLDGVVTENFLSFAFLGLKANADDLLEALKDGLTQPEFPLDRIDLVKLQIRNGIAHRNDDSATILRREFGAAIFGKDSPYGARVEYANLDRINQGDLVAFHRRYFFPKNLTIAVEGDFDAVRLKGRIEALFDDWKTDQPDVPPFPTAGTTHAPGKFLAVKKNLQRSYFTIGQSGGDYPDKDLAALEVLAGILGGAPQSRLNQLFRGDVDGLRVEWSPGFGHPGLFTVTGVISNPFLTPKVLMTAYDQLNKVRAEEVSEEELKMAKAAALNRMVFQFDNQVSILPRLAEYQYFNLPDDYTQQHQKALAEVTRADILRVARERLDPAKMTTVVVGNPTAFEAPLDAIGGSPVSTIDLTIPPPKTEVTLGDAVDQRRGKQLLARAQQAMGGTDKLAAVRDYVQEMIYQFDASAGGGRATMVEKWMASGSMRHDTTADSGKLSVYCDGKSGWISSGSANASLNGVQLKQEQSNLFHSMLPLVLSDRVAGRKITALDDRTAEISESGQIVKLIFDPATGLPKNSLYDAPTENGPVAVIESYSDFRDVGGLKVPHKTVITISGKRFQDLTITSLKFNVGLKQEDLEKRP
jgi:zinc protease